MMQRHAFGKVGRLACLMLLPAALSFAGAPPSQYGVDAPELAPLGAFAVGVKTLRLVQPNQADPLTSDAAGGFAKRDRVLVVDLWYPAHVAFGAARVTYAATLPSEPPAAPAAFSVPGIAVRDAPTEGGGYPLVIVSHGYSNATVAMSWLTENLASKGYVVAAIRHEDPPITDRSKFSQLLLRRPLDIAFVAQALQSTLTSQRLVDASRVALIGYSMGGYGVLTVAGVTLDPTASPTRTVPGGLLLPYTRGGASLESLSVKGLRAVVAMAPAGGGTLAAWGAEGLRALRTPLLLIAGDQDRTVNYLTGARAFFDAATNAPRYLLTLENCGHAIGLNPVPDAMRGKLWDQDWFEDPVWSKSRINSISAHFITAFLDRYVKGMEARAAFLDVSVVESSAGEWPPGGSAYNSFSPGGANTVWKGFQRNHASGMQLMRAAAAPRPGVDDQDATQNQCCTDREFRLDRIVQQRDAEQHAEQRRKQCHQHQTRDQVTPQQPEPEQITCDDDDQCLEQQRYDGGA